MVSRIVTKSSLLDKTIILWFATLFSLSSNFLKIDLGIISLSPTVLIPALSLIVFSTVRSFFLNGTRSDIEFRYVIISVFLFIILMLFQTIFSNWPNRAPSEFIKTFLFFFTTHAFFSMLSVNNITVSKVRISIWISLLFVLYLAYVYFVQFEKFWIGNDISRPTRTGRNTLALYLFLIVAMSTSLLYGKKNYGKKGLDYLSVIIFLVIGFLTGSRFAVVFPITFLVFIFFKNFLFSRFKKQSVFTAVFIFLALIIILSTINFSENSFLSEYFVVFDRLSTIGELGSDKHRVALTNIGFTCFADNNPLFGHGVKNYLTCVMQSPIGADLILHNDHLSILNNVGMIGYFLWLFAILVYSKIFHTSKGNYFFRWAVLVYIVSLLIIDGYNSPIFAMLLALARLEWYHGDRQWMVRG